MEKNEVFEIVKGIILEQLDTFVEENEITLKADIVEDLGADSLDTIEMIMTVEERFGLDIPDEDAALLTTVGDVVNYIVEGRSYLQKKEKIEKVIQN